MNIEQAFPLLMIQEGGATITNVSGDAGGLTKYGISKASHPSLDIASLTEEQAIDIYNKDYWGPAKCDFLKDELRYAHFSCAVNCGLISSAKILQRAAGVEDDGIIGPATISAADSLTLQNYLNEWAIHYQSIVNANPVDKKFYQGWLNRIDAIKNWSREGKI